MDKRRPSANTSKRKVNRQNRRYREFFKSIHNLTQVCWNDDPTEGLTDEPTQPPNSLRYFNRVDTSERLCPACKLATDRCARLYTPEHLHRLNEERDLFLKRPPYFLFSFLSTEWYDYL